jgi:hypothetical protein
LGNKEKEYIEISEKKSFGASSGENVNNGSHKISNLISQLGLGA